MAGPLTSTMLIILAMAAMLATNVNCFGFGSDAGMGERRESLQQSVFSLAFSAKLTSAKNLQIKPAICATSNKLPSNTRNKLVVMRKTLKMGVNEELWKAAEQGDINQVETQFANGANLNSQDPEDLQKTALHKAAFQGNPLVVSKLIELGADPNVQSETGATPLHIAAAYGHYTTISYLLQLGSDPSVTNLDGDTPLELAKFKGRFSDRSDFIEVVKLLERAGQKGKVAGASPQGRKYMEYFSEPRES
eukprot:12251-Hanusia_phi.AAC.1